jgi:hypothetical protein
LKGEQTSIQALPDLDTEFVNEEEEPFVSFLDDVDEIEPYKDYLYRKLKSQNFISLNRKKSNLIGKKLELKNSLSTQIKRELTFIERKILDLKHARFLKNRAETNFIKKTTKH